MSSKYLGTAQRTRPEFGCPGRSTSEYKIAGLQVGKHTGLVAAAAEDGRAPGEPPSGNAQSRSVNFDLNLPDFILNALVDGMFTQRPKVRIFCQPLEIPVAQEQRFFQSCGSHVQFAIKRITASEVVKNQRITRLKPGQLFVDLEAVSEFAALGVVVAQDLESFDVLWVAADNPLKKADFDIKVPRCFARRPFRSRTAFLRHTTRRIVSKRPAQVKRPRCLAREKAFGRVL